MSAMTITIELDSVEAHLILGPIGDAHISSCLAAAKGDEAAGIRAQVLSRVQNRIVDKLMPDPREVIFREEIELGML